MIRYNKIFLNVLFCFYLELWKETKNTNVCVPQEEKHLARGMEPWHFPRREQTASNIEGGCLVVFYLIRVQLTSDYITSKHWWQFLEYFTYYWATIPHIATCNDALDSMSQKFPWRRNFKRFFIDWFFLWLTYKRNKINWLTKKKINIRWKNSKLCLF